MSVLQGKSGNGVPRLMCPRGCRACYSNASVITLGVMAGAVGLEVSVRGLHRWITASSHCKRVAIAVLASNSLGASLHRPANMTQ